MVDIITAWRFVGMLRKFHKGKLCKVFRLSGEFTAADTVIVETFWLPARKPSQPSLTSLDQTKLEEPVLSLPINKQIIFQI